MLLCFCFAFDFEAYVVPVTVNSLRCVGIFAKFMVCYQLESAQKEHNKICTLQNVRCIHCVYDQRELS